MDCFVIAGVYLSEFVFVSLVDAMRMKILPTSCTPWFPSSLLPLSRDFRLKTRKCLRIKKM
jgi:hypothetical protein